MLGVGAGLPEPPEGPKTVTRYRLDGVEVSGLRERLACPELHEAARTAAGPRSRRLSPARPSLLGTAHTPSTCALLRLDA